MGSADQQQNQRRTVIPERPKGTFLPFCLVALTLPADVSPKAMIGVPNRGQGATLRGHQEGRQ
jgi:hypothetical protein